MSPNPRGRQKKTREIHRKTLEKTWNITWGKTYMENHAIYIYIFCVLFVWSLSWLWESSSLLPESRPAPKQMLLNNYIGNKMQSVSLRTNITCAYMCQANLSWTLDQMFENPFLNTRCLSAKSVGQFFTPQVSVSFWCILLAALNLYTSWCSLYCAPKASAEACLVSNSCSQRMFDVHKKLDCSFNSVNNRSSSMFCIR